MTRRARRLFKFALHVFGYAALVAALILAAHNGSLTWELVVAFSFLFSLPGAVTLLNILKTWRKPDACDRTPHA